MPPLIVTLGTFSLFRGLAEGITRGQGSFIDFPESFTWLGAGTLLGVPTAALAVRAGGGLLLCCWSTARRPAGLSAIGYSADGARHAGLRVDRLTGSAYVLAGLLRRPGGAGLRRPVRAGQGRRRHRVRAGGDHRRRARRARASSAARASVVGTLLGLLAVAFLENGLGAGAGSVMQDLSTRFDRVGLTSPVRPNWRGVLTGDRAC